MIHCLSAREQPTEFKMSIKYDASRLMNGESMYPRLPLPMPGSAEAGYFLSASSVRPPPLLNIARAPWLHHLSRKEIDIGLARGKFEGDKESPLSEELKFTKHCHTYNSSSSERAFQEYKQKHSPISSHNDLKPPSGLYDRYCATAKKFGYGDTDPLANSDGCSSYASFSSSMNGQDIRPHMTRPVSLGRADSVEARFIGSRDRRSQSYSPDKEDGMMDKEKEDGAINLSTASTEPSNSPITNGNVMVTTNGEDGLISQGPDPQASQASKFIPTVSSLGSSKRKQRPASVSGVGGELSPGASGPQSILMLAAQHGLSPQQMQQLLQQQQGALPQQLQQMMQQQQSYMMQHQQHQKVHEQMLHQLNEQLQLNVLQQSQLLQQEKGKSGVSKQHQQQIQQLGLQQQQLIQQIQQVQVQQRQYLFACLMQPFGTPQGMSPGEIQQLWKEVATQSSTEEQLKASLNGVGVAMATSGAGLTPDNPLLQSPLLRGNGVPAEGYLMPGSLIGQPQVAPKQEEVFSSPLYRHGVCKWPGCDMSCEDFLAFTKHLNSEHTLDDRNTAQARVQMQVVTQLEIQLTREKELLHAMMQHLHMKPHRDREELERELKTEPLMTSPKMSPPVGSPVKPPANLQPVSTGSLHVTPIPIAPMPVVTSVTSGLPPLVIPPPQPAMTSSKPATPQSQPSSQPPTPTGLGPIRRRVSDKCNLPISAEIQRNREFYKNTDVRPPFTYASLIRQAIIESENKQLTLNEVYQWFQNTFAYFRRNEATWKNAVRHNLSLHKCFMRVENVKGAVWTVDEIEYYKRRPQKLTGAIAGSPSLATDPAMYGDTINASIRAALEQSGMMMSQPMCNGSVSSDGAEDLSMKSQNNSNDSFSNKSGSPTREELLYLPKPEVLTSRDDRSSSPGSGGSGGDQPDDQYADLQAKQYMEAMVKHYSQSQENLYPVAGTYTEGVGNKYPEPNDSRYREETESQYTEPKVEQDEAVNQSEAMELEISQSESRDVNQSEALNMTREVEPVRSTSNEGSPLSSRASPIEQLSSSREVFPPLLQHSSSLPVVPHSISS